MIYKIWHSGEGVNNDSIHVEWVKPQAYHMDHNYAYIKAITGRPIPEGIRIPLLTKVIKAKLVDYISAAGIDSNFMILSENVLDIFGKINLPKHALVNVDIDGIKYFGLHFEEFVTNTFINWEQTSFYIRTGMEANHTNLYNFKKLDDFIAIRKELRITSKSKSKFKIASIQFNKPEYDLFYSYPPVSGIFCSQKFVDLVEARKITGFKFEPITERYPVIGMVE